MKLYPPETDLFIFLEYDDCNSIFDANDCDEFEDKKIFCVFFASSSLTINILLLKQVNII